MSERRLIEACVTLHPHEKPPVQNAGALSEGGQPIVEAIKEAIIKQSREPIARSKKLSCNDSFDRSKLKKNDRN